MALFQPGESAGGDDESAPRQAAGWSADQFRRQVGAWFSNRLHRTAILQAGPASEALVKGGLAEGPVEIKQSVLNKMREAGLTQAHIESMPEALRAPIAIFNTHGQDGQRLVLTELADANGRSVTVGVHVRETLAGNIVNDVRTAQGRDQADVARWLADDQTTRWVDKEKAVRWLETKASVDPTRHGAITAAIERVAQRSGEVKPDLTAGNALFQRGEDDPADKPRYEVREEDGRLWTWDNKTDQAYKPGQTIYSGAKTPAQQARLEGIAQHLNELDGDRSQKAVDSRQQAAGGSAQDQRAHVPKGNSGQSPESVANENKGGPAGAGDAELNATVDRATVDKKSPILAVGAAREAASKLDPTRRGVPSKIDEARAIWRALWTKYSQEPAFDDYMQAKGKWDGARQIAQLQARRLKETFDKSHDDKAQEGMFNWIEAGGDADTLRQWAAQTNDPKLRAGYQRALNLSPAEVRDAQALQKHWTSARQFAVDNGLWINFLQNYATHIQQNDNPVVRGLLGDYLYGKLSTRFQYAKGRVFPTAFEAEQEGFPLRTKKAGEVAAIWTEQMNKTLADRAWIKDNLDVKAPDGRPIFAVAQGTGRVMEPRTEWLAGWPGTDGGKSGKESKVFYEEAGQARADAERYAKQFPGMTVTERASQPPVMVKPYAKNADLADYITSGHPALRKWVYAATTPEGSPVFVESQVLVHPHYVKDVENALGSSKLNEIPLVRGLTALQSSMKQTMLSASFFHPVQIGVHALEHKTWNLANLKEIDPSDPAQRSLIEHGLNIAPGSVAHGDSGTEGLMGGGGLLAKIPIVGKKLIQPLSDWTFHDFIPRIKMTTGLEALERNRATYAKDIAAGKITDHQIIAKTAAEMNAAFGELNYNMLGRNPSLQHFLRLTLLAPDFLEARSRFVGQAAKPFGAEQRWALARGAVAMFVAARVANYFTGEDDPKRKPFSIIANGREYGLRTVQGDILHLINSPRSFAFGRVSPLLGKSGLELATGRDFRGEPVSTGDLFSDLAKGWIPITFRNAPDRKLFDNLLTNVGVTEGKYRTAALEQARELHAATLPRGPLPSEQRDKALLVGKLIQQRRAGEDVDAAVTKALQTNQITEQDARRITKAGSESELASLVHRLPTDAARQVRDNATPAEHQELDPIIAQRDLASQAKALRQQYGIKDVRRSAVVKATVAATGQSQADVNAAYDQWQMNQPAHMGPANEMAQAIVTGEPPRTLADRLEQQGITGDAAKERWLKSVELMGRRVAVDNDDLRVAISRALRTDRKLLLAKESRLRRGVKGG